MICSQTENFFSFVFLFNELERARNSELEEEMKTYSALKQVYA